MVSLHNPETLVTTSLKCRRFSWDPAAAVYVSVGIDDKPGVAKVDDNGNGIVDERLELGATESDDQVLTPGGAGYEQAAAGKVLAMVLSHGAMIPVVGDQEIRGPGQVRIDTIGEGDHFRSRIVDLGLEE